MRSALFLTIALAVADVAALPRSTDARQLQKRQIPAARCPGKKKAPRPFQTSTKQVSRSAGE